MVKKFQFYVGHRTTGKQQTPAFTGVCWDLPRSAIPFLSNIASILDSIKKSILTTVDADENDKINGQTDLKMCDHLFWMSHKKRVGIRKGLHKKSSQRTFSCGSPKFARPSQRIITMVVSTMNMKFSTENADFSRMRHILFSSP